MTELQRVYNNMLVTLEKGLADLEKFEDGNASAGTRVLVQEQKNAVPA